MWEVNIFYISLTQYSNELCLLYCIGNLSRCHQPPHVDRVIPRLNSRAQIYWFISSTNQSARLHLAQLSFCIPPLINGIPFFFNLSDCLPSRGQWLLYWLHFHTQVIHFGGILPKGPYQIGPFWQDTLYLSVSYCVYLNCLIITTVINMERIPIAWHLHGEPHWKHAIIQSSAWIGDY